MRPIFHLQPRSNWMNDPNGPAFFGGEWHIFYQHNPLGPEWGNMTWGHAASRDLARWRHLPHALSPSPGGPDQDGVFSGCCVVLKGKPYLLYTGVRPEVLCLATGDERGEAFAKYPGNPILRVENARYTGWRDPFVWPEGGGYRMIIGSGERGRAGFALPYQSADLLSWEPLGELCRGDAAACGDMWECPNFLRFDDQAALIVSSLPAGEVLCLQGGYSGGRLTPGRPWRYDLGDCFYAPNTALAPDGRYLQWGWMRERGDPALRAAQGWQGMLTLPREVRMTRSGLSVRPAREVSLLRGEKLWEGRNFSLRSGENALKGLSGRHLEIFLQFEPGANTLLLEVLRGGPNRCARLAYDGASDELTASFPGTQGGAARPDTGGATVRESRTELRVFVDGSAIEIFCNGRETLTTRAYAPPGCDGLRLYAQGGVRVLRAEVYAMRSAYEEVPED